MTNVANDNQTVLNGTLKGFMHTTALTAAGAIALASSPAMAQEAWNLDTDYGDFETTFDGNHTNIDVGSAGGAGGSGDLDIDAHESVHVALLNSRDRFVGRDTKNDPTLIYGRLSSNGQIFILDENGIIFGADSVVDVGSIVASTGDILNMAEFRDGAAAILGNLSDAAVINEGSITVAEAGVAAFVAPHVANRGVINAKLGRVILTDGSDQATVDLYGDGLIEIAVGEEKTNTLVENTGEINAEGGTVVLTAGAAKEVVDNVVNMDGVINVSSVEVVGGKIVLKGGSVNVSGEMDASGTEGGDVDVEGGEVVLAEESVISADSISGEKAGSVFIWGDRLQFDGLISAQGQDGFVETSGDNVGVGESAMVLAEQYLLDPLSILISNSFNGAFTNFSAIALGNMLSAGTSVTLETGVDSSANFALVDNQGDIRVQDDIEHDGAADSTLTLTAIGDIYIEDGADIEAVGAGKLNVELEAKGEDFTLFGFVPVFNDGDIIQRSNSDIRTNGGYVKYTAADDIRIDDDIRTNGGDATFIAGDEFELDDSNDTINTTGSAGDVTILSDSFDLDGTINAGEGTITIGRDSNGQIDVGDWNGSGHRISQAEIDRMTSDTIVIGVQGNGVDNNVRVDNADFRDFNTTKLNTKTPSGGTDEEVTFEGINRFDNLEVFADDSVLFANNAQVWTDGTAKFTTDTNGGGVGGFFMGDDSLLQTDGQDIEINTLQVLLGTGAKINADGGNIDINNEGIFAAADADSVRTHSGGTISLNQYDEVFGTTPGLIQNAIDAILNTGDGQNTIDVFAGEGDAVYEENLTINQANLKLNGVDGEGIVISGNGTDPVISVEADNFNLDPVVVDGNGADYGVVITDVDGTIIDGNTFRDTAVAGIRVEDQTSGTTLIKGNTFEGDATRGVQTGTLSGGSTLNILTNVIGVSAGDRVFVGVEMESLDGANATLRGNLIFSSNDGVRSNGEIEGGSELTIATNRINAGDDGVDLDHVDGGASVLIGGFSNSQRNVITAGDDAIEFDAGIDGENTRVTIENNDLGAGDNGIEITDRDPGHVTAIDNGATVNIWRNDIGTGTAGNIGDDGVEVKDSITGGATLNIASDNNIVAGDDGIDLDVIDNATVRIIANERIEGQGTNGAGIEFQGEIKDATVNIADNDNIVGTQDGIDVQKKVIRSTMTIADNNDGIFGGRDGIRFGGNIRNSVIDIVRNIIEGGEDGIDMTDINLKNGTQVNVKYNKRIVGGDEGDGVRIHDSEKADDATVVVEENEYITAGDDGVDLKKLINAIVKKNKIFNAGDEGVQVFNSDGTLIARNRIFDAGDNGIWVKGGTDHNIRRNRIRRAGNDGIKVEDFGSAWIAYNDIKWTGDDGIHAEDGDFVSIYDNYIDLSGYLPGVPVLLATSNVGASVLPLGNIEVGEDANGIYVDNVGEGDIPDIGEEEGFGYSLYGASVEIYGNDVANSQDDGIQAKNSDSAYIGYNIVGHVGDDGVDVDDVGYTKIVGNAVTLAEDKGITIDGGYYAGVFGNRVLLTGNDGIQVENIRYNHDDDIDITILGDDEYGYGWAVNVSGNEVAFTGDDGIEVRYSDATKVARNKVFAAGLGEGLVEVINKINTFANGTFIPVFNLSVEADYELPSLYEFTWNWGNGHGINVHGIDGSYYSPNGWAADIRNNRVKWTGGHGILAENNDRTRINRNRTRYSGINSTTFYGSYGMTDLLNKGPFHSEDRRDLWMSTEDSMIAVMEDFIGASEDDNPGEYEDYIVLGNIDFDSHDGIHAQNIYGQSDEGKSGGSYLFDLIIRNNDVRITGDDGIEAAYAGRTLIAGNTVRHAGFGDDRDYGSGDYYGADGIHARGIEADIYGGRYYGDGLYEGEEGYEYEPAENYALIVRNNDVRRTADDGIEVVGGELDVAAVAASSTGGVCYDCVDDVPRYYGHTDRVLIAENTVRRAGVVNNEYKYDYKGDWEPESNLGPDGYGHDGIHVRGIFGDVYYDVSQQAAGSTASGGGEYGFYGYAADVIDNDVRRTGDDGIEVINSASTLIYDNTVRRAGVGGGYYYGGADYFGADGIHVRNVGGFGNIGPQPGVISEGFEPYAVVVAGNDVARTQDDGIEVVGLNRLRVSNALTTQRYLPPSKFGGTGRTLILDNVVSDAGYGDIEFYDEYGDGYGADGIHVRGIRGFLERNDDPETEIVFTGPAGLIGGNGSEYEIQIIGNKVSDVADDGAEVLGNPFAKNDVLIDDNMIENAGDNGIVVEGQAIEVEMPIDQIGPTLTQQVYYLPFEREFNATITNNVVNNSGQQGEMEGFEYNNGIAALGGHNDNIVIAGNELNDNPTGIYGESGAFDFTGDTNFINGGETGIRFSRYEGEAPLSLVSSPADIPITDGTYGTTTFTGQTGNYIEYIGDGTFSNGPNDPIFHDASFATFDGITPDSFARNAAGIPILPQDIFDFLEGKIQHFNDDINVGLVLFGTTLTLDNEDFFRTIDGFNPGAGGFSLTITGLPSTGGPAGGLPGIQPAAGEGEEEDPAALADIEPAAGGEGGEGEAADCWADAVVGAQGGAPVTFSFNEEDTDGILAAPTACQFGSLF